MRKILAVLFFLGGWAIVSGQDAEQVLRDRGEVFFWFSRPHNLSVHQLTQIISIDRVKGDSVFAYANAEEYKALLALGIRPNILTAPSLVYKQKMQAPGKGAVAWDSYPTYEGYLALMAGYAASFPDICRLDTIGTSVNGRYLLALKLSDSAKSDQPEPEVFYTSSIHGDETTGYGLLLHLIDTLVTSYGTSPRLTRMLDSLEIWINPLANPDGTYYSGNASVTGATRYNANGYDLNRNFPDIRYQDDTVWQPETRAMINFMQQRRFVLSANFHGGAEVMNYPWDTWVTRHPDTDWFEFISHLFADTSMYYGPEGYFKDTYPSGVTNGYDWYDVYGGRQDFTTYALRGREITIEISGIKLIPSSSLHAYWDYNRRSLINYLEQAMYGIQGYVVDSATGVPLHASVEVLNHDLASANSSVWSDSVTGRFTRLIAAGNWDLVFQCQVIRTIRCRMYRYRILPPAGSR
ncbi:MAG: M14 family zinc carboxypeptidase [Bacteroidales bacterium]